MNNTNTFKFSSAVTKPVKRVPVYNFDSIKIHEVLINFLASNSGYIIERVRVAGLEIKNLNVYGMLNGINKI